MRALQISTIVLALSLLIPAGCGGDKAPDAVPEAVAKAEAPKAEAPKAGAPKAEAPKAAAPKAAAAPASAGDADCKAACANLTKLMMSTLPPETPANMREGAMKELATCPADCAKESNPAEVKCLISATSMGDLQKCTGLK
jgi:hypothetical protein